MVRFTVYDYLVTTNKASRTGAKGYRDFEAGLKRLRGTLIKTDIATGGVRIKDLFALIEKSRIVEKSPDDNRMVAVEITFTP
jgi:replication initiator protein A